MRHVVFLAPRFLENTNRYVRAFAELDDVTLSLISLDPEEAIPAPLRPRVAAHYRVADLVDVGQLTTAVRALAGALGRVDRLVGFLEQVQLPMAEVRDALGIEGMSAAVARNFRDKDRMKQVLRAAKVPVARSTLATSPEELYAFVDRVGLPIILKPQAGLGAKATYRIDDVAELAAVLPPSAKQPIQVEEFVRAREHTCETITVRGVPVWRSGTRYFPSPLEVLETPWMQYCVLLPREDDDPTWAQFHGINTAALEALFGDQLHTSAASALTHMEWFLREDGSQLVNEVGVRPPGVHIMSLMSLAHDVDFFSAWARLLAFDEFVPPTRRLAAGSVFFRGHGGGTHVAQVSGVERALAEAGDAVVEFRPPRVGQPRNEGYEGEGYAVLKHATTEGIKRAMLALIEGIQVRYR